VRRRVRKAARLCCCLYLSWDFSCSGRCALRLTLLTSGFIARRHRQRLTPLAQAGAMVCYCAKKSLLISTRCEGDRLPGGGSGVPDLNSFAGLPQMSVSHQPTANPNSSNVSHTALKRGIEGIGHLPRNRSAFFSADRTRDLQKLCRWSSYFFGL
jgi:hypothetical protein